MKSCVQIESDKPKQTKKILEKSLESDSKVRYSIKTGKDNIEIKVNAEGIGVLRGCTDTVFRLTTLTNRITNR